MRVLGRDVRALRRATSCASSFAVVPQDVFLFPGTVATNVAVGDAEPDRDQVVRALERIGALDLFERREGGLDAPRGRARRELLRRRAPAHRLRARALPRSADPHPRRGDRERRQRHRGAPPARARGRHEGPHRARHRAPPLDDPRASIASSSSTRAASSSRARTTSCSRAGGVYARLYRLQFAQSGVPATRRARRSGRRSPRAGCARCGTRAGDDRAASQSEQLRVGHDDESSSARSRSFDLERPVVRAARAGASPRRGALRTPYSIERQVRLPPASAWRRACARARSAIPPGK